VCVCVIVCVYMCYSVCVCMCICVCVYMCICVYVYRGRFNTCVSYMAYSIEGEGLISVCHMSYTDIEGVSLMYVWVGVIYRHTNIQTFIHREVYISI
jgi:hypothetical protein